MNMTLVDAGFSVRARQVFQRIGVETLEEIAAVTDKTFLLTRGCGESTLEEIRRMTKKKATKTVTKSTEGGTVTVNCGLRLSANYQSADFNIGMTLPIEPLEDPEDALVRVHQQVEMYFNNVASGAFESLDAKMSDVKSARQDKR